MREDGATPSSTEDEGVDGERGGRAPVRPLPPRVFRAAYCGAAYLALLAAGVAFGCYVPSRGGAPWPPLVARAVLPVAGLWLLGALAMGFPSRDFDNPKLVRLAMVAAILAFLLSAATI